MSFVQGNFFENDIFLAAHADTGDDRLDGAYVAPIIQIVDLPLAYRSHEGDVEYMAAGGKPFPSTTVPSHAIGGRKKGLRKVSFVRG